MNTLAWFTMPGQSREVYVAAIITALLGFALMFGLMFMPARGRRPLVVGLTFIAGLYYILVWLWPKAVEIKGEVPLNNIEAVSKGLEGAQAGMSDMTTVLAGFLLGLGVWSVLRIHAGRVFKKQINWQYSLALLVSMVLMVVAGYANYNGIVDNPELADPAKAGFWQYANDFLFIGMFQQMDSAMFSIISFFILFAAYRSFRIRSIESTILLASALLVMLSLMAISEYWVSRTIIDNITGLDPAHPANNFSLVSIKNWIAGNIQAPGIRGLEWGITIGALSMGLRLWLSLEKGAS